MLSPHLVVNAFAPYAATIQDVKSTLGNSTNAVKPIEKTSKSNKFGSEQYGNNKKQRGKIVDIYV